MPQHLTLSNKVTICSDFFGTVSNFDGLSRLNYEVSWDAELSRILNTVPILPLLNDNIYTITPIPIMNSLSSYAFLQAQNAPNPFLAGALPRTPLGELTMLPRPLASWRDTPSPYPSPSMPLMSRFFIVDL